MSPRFATFRTLPLLIMSSLLLVSRTDAATHTVSFQNFAFTPSALTVDVGDTVVFERAGGTHTVTGIGADPFCGSDPVSTSCSVTFNQAGVFPYRCLFHSTATPQLTGMTGSVTVVSISEKPNLVPFHLDGWTSAVVLSREPGDHISDPDFADDQDIYLDWAIANISRTTDIAPRFFTEVLIDGQFQSSWFHDGLAADTYNTIEDFNLGKFPAGDHVLTLITDHTGVVDESDENDNTFEGRFRVFESFANQHTVLVSNFQFNPSSLTIRKGDTVTFRVLEGSHTATGTGTDPFCGSSAIPETCSVTFNETGTFPYQCSFHSSLGMLGEVRVIDEVLVQMAEKVDGPYVASTGAKINYEKQTITFAAPETTTFWRLSSTVARRVVTVEADASSILLKFE